MKTVSCSRGLQWIRPIFAWAVLGLLMLAGCSADSMQAAYLQANQEQLQHAASATPQPVQFTIEPGTAARDIAENLQAAGLITDARLFEAYVRVQNLSNRLQAGTYTLSPDMTPVEIVEALQHGRANSLTVTIPEGWRLEQVADYLTSAGILDGTGYRRLADGSDLNPLFTERYGFLAVRPAGAGLEGYLFPDTYELPLQGATPADLVQRQLGNFSDQALPLYQKAFDDGSTHLDLHAVVTLASIVEREAVVDEERPMIARVYLNRLQEKMPLQADPTVQYAMGYQATDGQWWKTPVSLEEYATVESPYNTYLNPGLPPGPICSPGLSSIRAVLYPAEHDYLYFVAIPGTGRHVFARTFAEHEANVRRYQGQ